VFAEAVVAERVGAAPEPKLPRSLQLVAHRDPARLPAGQPLHLLIGPASYRSGAPMHQPAARDSVAAGDEGDDV